MANSKDTGDATEALVIQRMVDAGYSVSIPFGDNDPYDLIVDTGDELYRIQCKTAWMDSEDRMRFNSHSQTTADGEYTEESYGDGIDAFVVKCPKNGDLYWIDVDEASGCKTTLRFDSDIDHPSIRWAEDHRFDGEIVV